MAGCNSKLADKGFINWIKATLAANTLKNALQDLMESEINLFHQKSLNSIATKEQIKNKELCFSCTTENVLPCGTRNFCPGRNNPCNRHDSGQKAYQLCPQNICNKFKDIIIKHHNYNCPSWKNTCAENWCNSPWEVGKCYLPPDGYLAKLHIQESDLNGILSLLLNHTDFKRLVDETLCKEVRVHVNNLRHSANLCVEERYLGTYLKALVDFLKSSYTLQTDVKAKDAAQTIFQLQKDKLSISNGDISKLIEKCIEERTQRCVEEISDKTKQELHDLREALEELKSKSISDIISVKEEAIEDINTVAADAIASLEKSVERAKKDIELATRRVTSNAEQSFEVLKNDFKEDLISFNVSRHSTIPITPLFEDTDAYISEFYVKQDAVAIQGHPQGPEIRVPVNSLQEMFYREDTRYNEIYLTADAGFGKTCFTKYLVSTWCQAQQCKAPIQYFSEEDIATMKHFDLVILVQLRDMYEYCDVDVMIFKQIVKHFSRSDHFTMQFLQDILHKLSCLIILDGLDEWSHPVSSSCIIQKNIPHRKARPMSTVLTTTRQWKLDTIDIKSSQIDKRIELSGLSGDSISRLKSLAISKLEVGNDKQRVIANINEEIKIKELGNLESNPMLLMFLICVWCELKSLGNTKTELYGQIIELLFSRAMRKAEWRDIEGVTDLTLDTSDQEKMPACLREHDLCIKYYKLLKRLGYLAFETLFSENRMNTLVFDDTKTVGFLSRDFKRLSLLSGILTETKVPGGLIRRRYKVSFCHKTVQEYLAALYMQTPSDKDDILEKTRTICKSVERILEMSNLFVFLSGLNYKTFICISYGLADAANRDVSTSKYRHGCISSTSNYSNIVKPLKDLQNMYINCIKEVQEEDDKSLHFSLHDLFIDGDYVDGTYKATLQKIKKVNKIALASVDIRSEGNFKLHNIINTFELHKETCLDKINFRGECSSTDLQCLISGSADNLKCVELLSSEWKDNKFTLKYVTWINSLSNTFQNMHNLEALHLYAFAMTHTQLSEMMAFMTGRTTIKDIALLNLKCSDHNSACNGCVLDLSKHDRLRLLSLDNVHISQLSINGASLQDSVVGRFTNSGALSAYLSALKTATEIRKFTCRNIRSHAEIDAMLKTLNELVCLRYVGLLYIDLGETTQLLGSRLSNIEVVRLVEVTMKCSVVGSLIEVIKQFRQQVTVVLEKCEVQPEDAYETVKRDIKRDDKMLIIFDGVCKSHIKQFMFKSLGT